MAEAPAYKVASEILIDRDANGAPRVRIDGMDLPFYTQGIAVKPPSLTELATVTLTFLAERVVVEDEQAARLFGAPHEWTDEEIDRETAPMRAQKELWEGPQPVEPKPLVVDRDTNHRTTCDFPSCMNPDHQVEAGGS